MALNQNWTRYEVDIGWKEVSSSEVFNDSVVMELLEQKIDKQFLMNILNPTYSNGKLEF